MPDLRSKLVVVWDSRASSFAHAESAPLSFVSFYECKQICRLDRAMCIRTKHEAKKCKSGSNAWQWFVIVRRPVHTR